MGVIIESMKKLMPKGFTIIEVIIVLVVGAVIMLAVFIVVPQLQQSARNNQRSKDAQRVLTAVRQLATQNALPTTGFPSVITSQVVNIVGTQFNDPSLRENTNSPNSAYTVKYRNSTAAGYLATWINVFKDYKCKDNDFQVSPLDLEASINSFAVVISLEPVTGPDSNGNYNPSRLYCISD